MGETSTVIQVEFWEIVALGAVLLLAFFGSVWSFGAALMTQIEKRAAERFTAQEQLGQQAAEHLDQRLSSIDERLQSTHEDVQRFKLKVAEEYWRREDAIREQVTLHAKIDALALKIENWALRQKMEQA